jgi:hypothetical protein
MIPNEYCRFSEEYCTRPAPAPDAAWGRIRELRIIVHVSRGLPTLVRSYGSNSPTLRLLLHTIRAFLLFFLVLYGCDHGDSLKSEPQLNSSVNGHNQPPALTVHGIGSTVLAAQARRDR